MNKKADITQKYINKLIRERDMVDGWGKCCSCGEFKQSIDAGHYIAVGASSYLRYCPLNIHGQCQSCNRFGGGGRAIGYGAFIIRKYGHSLVLALDEVRSVSGFHKLDKDDMRKLSLNEITHKYYGILLKRWEAISPSEYRKWNE